MALGLKVTGETIVYKSDKGYGYSTSISNKNMEGKYERMYININFKKGNEPTSNQTRIRIDNGFLTFNVGKDGTKWIKIMVLDYVEIGDMAIEQEAASLEIAPTDLPF